MDDRDELKGGVKLRDDRSRLSAKLGNTARTFDLGSGRSDRALGWIGALRHAALLAGHMLLFKAKRGPDHGVELKEEQQGQNQAHTVQ